MPDLGRWNGIDQLAESYLSTSPFAYVANNPVSRFDVDGRWMDDSGHITDTTGQTFGFHGSQYNPLMSFSTYDGMHTNEGAGVTDNGNNRIAQGPKPNIFKTIGNFVKRLLGKVKNKIEIGIVETTTPYTAIEDFSEDTANFLDRYIHSTNETFYSFSGGNNDPDKETLNKLRPGDNIEANNMFEYILNGTMRAVKIVNLRPDHYQTAIDMMSLSSLPRGNGFYSPEGFDRTVESDTLSYYGVQSVGIISYKGNDNNIVGFGIKTIIVNKNNMSGKQHDSLINRINSDHNYYNKKVSYAADSLLHQMLRK
ncbi:RHS repeat-associated core domain-containing protein [Chryseobacterium culicis]|uniref:hypothetical protein n=1 Tax=Chryseobacterium culicis TaxID=680127 RepID=UPI000AEF361D|nr:hypothetical protein [Chryseobacterium culicis]